MLVLNSEVVYSKQLRVLSKTVGELQSDTIALSKAGETWLNITEDPPLKTHKTTLRKRFDLYVESFRLLANMTDSKYIGKRLKSVQKNGAEK